MRKARASEARVLLSSSTISRCAIEFDPEGCAFAFLAFDGDAAVVIADHALHNCKTQAGPVLLGGVVGGEQAVALLCRQPLSRIRDFEPRSSIDNRRAQRQIATLRHRID